MAKSPDAAQIARQHADRGRDVRLESLNASGEQGGKRYERAAPGDAVGDARSDTRQKKDGKSPEKWKSGGKHPYYST